MSDKQLCHSIDLEYVGEVNLSFFPCLRLIRVAKKNVQETPLT